MTKILYFITQSEYGGAQRYVFDLANNLGREFEVAVALGEQGKDGKLAKKLEENNIKYYIIPHLKRSISPLNEILAFFEISKLIKNYQPNIIHLNSSKISILGSLAGLFIKLKIKNLKIIYTVHGWVFNEPLPAPVKWFYLWAEKFTAKFKDKIICVSESDRQVALKYKIAPVEKLITIHNGLAPVNFYTREEALPLLAKERAGGEVFIGSIGNLYKTKGFEYLIEAADILTHKLNTPATFIIIGEGKEREALKNLIAKYNLKNNFILAGSIDEAARLLPAFDVYVCSSVKEGLSYTLIEAMQAGRPIVATAVGGNPEMIENEKTGLLSKPADARDLAEKIKTLLNNKTLALELGQNAKAKAMAEFGLEKMVEQTKVD
ncbi:glycosyltransferase family 4 protein [Candidatus Falkowbacteria bacterium]|nr:glycosyltransferase family 4 protein [Candidatus Falkowbacteria bacterium]